MIRLSKAPFLFVVFATAVFWSSCSSDDNLMSSSDVDFITVKSGAVTLAAELDLPPGEGPFPAMVFVHGSGRITRHQFTGAARWLASNGIAMLRFDKRGVGESTGEYRGVNAFNSIEMFDTLAQDVLAAVAYLKTHPKIDPGQIGLYGVSQAGWIMPLAASRSNDVAFMISISGAASTIGISDFYDQIAEQGLSDEEIAEALRNFDNTHGFDPAPFLETFTIPALWIYGGQDKSNPTANDIAILEKIKAEKNKDFTIHLFPNANHGLTDVRTGQLVPASQNCVIPWLRAHTSL